MAHSPNIVTLFVFFFGLALCFWRAPNADRWHVSLCLIAAGLWISLVFLDPTTRNPMFAVATSTFLIIALAKYFRRRPELRSLR
jgi:uncharacterized membrane protein YjjB (DUF3815 family)